MIFLLNFLSPAKRKTVGRISQPAPRRVHFFYINIFEKVVWLATPYELPQ